MVALAAGNPGTGPNPGATSTVDPSRHAARTTTAPIAPASTHVTASTSTHLTSPHVERIRSATYVVLSGGAHRRLDLVGLISNDYLPDPKQQIPAQYRRVGVKTSKMEITAGTSIVETLPGGLNAQTVASDLIHHGYHGCWVIALGTNDDADVAVGSNVPLAQRIKKMMAIIGKQPVMWVNVKTLLTSGPYAESGMQKWNAALISACARYPNMRVYNWAAAVKNKWFYDGIHYYSDGTRRAHT